MFINEFRVKLCETGTPYHLYEPADQNGPAGFCQIETASCHRTCQPVDQNQFSVRHNRRAAFDDWLIWPDNLWQVAWVNSWTNPVCFLRYQGVPHGSSEQNNERSRPETRSDLDVEAAKARPNISGPTLNSTTRNGSDLTLKRNTLSSTSTSKEPAKQDKPDREPLIALKPTPKIPNKQVDAKWETSTKYPPPNLRTREWPRKDEKDSLNRVSSPTEISKPVNPIKPSRPKSHAGILDKPAVPPPPSRKEPVKPPKPRRPESLAGVVDKHEPAKPFKPRRPESHAGVIDKPEAGKRAKPRRPESHAGVLDKQASPSWKKPLPPSAAGEKKSEMTGASNPPANPPKVPVRPPLRPVEARLRRQSSEERPTSLPLKPSDLKKAGVATGIKKPSSFSKADKKVALRPPGPIPPRPGTKPT